MKKSLRIFVAVLLVVVLAAGCFTGCKSKSFEEKYGITISDKTVTYDGNSYGIEVDVNKEILKDREYSVEYTYSKDGEALSDKSFKDAGVYNVVASVLVAGEDTPTELKATLTINKANVTIELGNFFLRQGQGISTIGTAYIPETTKLTGNDKVSDLGKVSYEVYQGSTKVTDVSTLKPTTKEADALTVTVKFDKEPANYNFEFNNGKLYVLSSADYSVADRLKKEIATVPTSETINTFTYDQMESFVNTADDVVSSYPGTSAIQRLMCGTVNIDSISGLLKTAKTRLSMTYSVDSDIDSSVGKVFVIAGEHTKNNSRQKSDDDFLSELMGTKNSSLTDYEYKDIICFAVYIKDVTKYELKNVTVRGKDFTPSQTITKVANVTSTVLKEKITAAIGKTELDTNEAIYLFGTPRELDDAKADTLSGTARDNVDSNINYKHWYGSKNYGAIAGVTVNSAVLGALDGSAIITIRPNYTNLYTIKVGGEQSNTFITGGTGSTISDIIKNASKVTLTVKGDTYFNATSSAPNTVTTKLIANGSVARLAITPDGGYVISEVEIGDTTVAADKFTYNSYEYYYEFTVTEDMVDSNGDLKIYVKLIDSYSLKVKINGFEIKNSSKNGVYTDKNNFGTIKLSGDAIVSSDVPTVLKEKTLTIEATPNNNYILKELKLVGKTSGDEDGSYDLLQDAQFSFVNGKVSLDISTDAKDLVSSQAVSVVATFAEQYPVKVTSSRNGVGVETATTSGNTFTTKYGKVTIYNNEDDSLTKLYNGQSYYIQIESSTGYVPKKITIGGTSYTLAAKDEYTRYQVIMGSDMYVVSSSNDANSPKYLNSVGTFGSTTPSSYYLVCTPVKLNAGENFVIDIEYDAYYMIDLSVSTSHLTAKLGVRYNVTSANGAEAYNTDSNITIGGVKLVANESSAIYRAVSASGSSTLYAYFNDTTKNKLTLDITAGDEYHLEDPTWQFGLSAKETKSKITVTNNKSYTEALDDTCLGGSTPENAKLAPGASITISFDCNLAKVVSSS